MTLIRMAIQKNLHCITFKSKPPLPPKKTNKKPTTCIQNLLCCPDASATASAVDPSEQSMLELGELRLSRSVGDEAAATHLPAYSPDHTNVASSCDDLERPPQKVSLDFELVVFRRERERERERERKSVCVCVHVCVCMCVCVCVCVLMCDVAFQCVIFWLCGTLYAWKESTF